jgi:multiple sugar transport system substrate-binding protein
MKKLRKLFALTLVLILAISLAACDGGKDNDADNEYDSSADTVQSETEHDSTGFVVIPSGNDGETWITDYKYMPVDLGRRHFRFATNYKAGEDSTDTVLDPDWSMESIQQFWNVRRVERKFNVTYEFMNVPWGDLNTMFLTSVMSGQPYADLATMTDAAALFSAIRSGLIMPMEDVVPLDDPAFSKNHEEQIILHFGFPIDDKHYFIDSKNYQIHQNYNGVNQDIVGRLSVANPVELFDSGQWTFDTFRATAMAATIDTSGSGEIDQWGYGGNYLTLAACLMASNNVVMFEIDTLTSLIDSAPALRVFEFIEQLYADRFYYVPEGGIWDWDANFNSYRNGNVAMYLFAIWMREAARIPFDYNLIGWPAGPDSETGWGGFYANPLAGWIMPINAQEPKDIIMVFEEHMSWFGDDWEANRAGGTKEWGMSRVKHYDDLARIHRWDMERGIPSLHGVIDWPMNHIIIDIVQNGLTVAQATDKWSAFAQNEVYRVFDPTLFDQSIVDAMEEDEEE